jgi:DNA-binding transcriptional LysR family regulator
MELRHLRYFVAVAEEENVSRAASKLYVSQPGISRQIHNLENEIGFPLFERGGKSVRLTVADWRIAPWNHPDLAGKFRDQIRRN